MQSNDIYEQNRKHRINDHYFDFVDTEEKAYWLGFLWADGGLCKTAPRCSGPNRLRLSQHEKDSEILEKFSAAIDSTYPIKSVPKNIKQLDINSQPLCQALVRLGYGLKNERTQIPNIPEELVCHFIRGYFDSDGCLSLYQQHVKQWTINKQEWSLTGNEALLLQIKDILEQHAHVTPTVSLKRYKRTDQAVTLRYGKKADIENLFYYLYNNDTATVYLTRKYQKFLEYFSR